MFKGALCIVVVVDDEEVVHGEDDGDGFRPSKADGGAKYPPVPVRNATLPPGIDSGIMAQKFSSAEIPGTTHPVYPKTIGCLELGYVQFAHTSRGFCQ